MKLTLYTVHADEACGVCETRLHKTEEAFNADRRGIIEAAMTEEGEDSDLPGLAELRAALAEGDMDAAWDVFQEANAKRNASVPHGYENHYHCESHEISFTLS